MRKIIGIGETILDILFKNNQATTSVPGGSTFNSMISLGRVGIPSCFLSEIGGDKVGKIVRNFLSDNGVDDRYLTEYPECKSPISLAFLDDHNNATYSFYKDSFGKRSDWECPSIGRDDIILFGSYYALNPDMRYKVTALLEEARSAGAIIYYDVNFRRNHAGEAIKLMGAVIENLEYADIIKGSDEDFEVLYGINEGSRVFKEKIEFYTPRLIYSRGSQGVDIYSRTLTKRYSIEPVIPVSTIGAGDNLNAGILYGLIKYRIRRDDLDYLTEHDWDNIIRCGLEFSADTCRQADNYISHEFATLQMREN
ncbi:MAG: carbohydrate kinase [Bacteroidaceae bacterium]|jgi:fructokinase|nr:carbohydrate kinase [Bacteroidaceae bacterium]